jgi:hypothetical protein
MTSERDHSVPDLHALRRVDWRFLLPSVEVHRILVTQPMRGRYGPGLEVEGVEVGEIAGGADVDGASADAVASHPDPIVVGELVRRRPDLPIYVELGPRQIVDPRWWMLLRRHPGTCFLALPNHERRRAFVPVDDRRALGWSIASKGGMAASCARIGWADSAPVRATVAKVAPARAVLLSPTPALHSIGAWVEGEGLLGAGERGPASHILVTPRFSTSRHVVVLAGRDDPEVVVKTTRLAGSGVDHEVAALRALWAATRGRDVGAPRVLKHATWGRRRILAETAVAGTPVTAASAAQHPEAIATEVTSWILGLPRGGTTAGAERLSTLLDGPLAQLAAAGGPAEEQLVEATRGAVMHLAERELPAVFEHGDVSAPNILRTGGGLALIDWELSQAEGLPAHDLFIALGFVARSSSNLDGSRALVHAFLGAPPGWVHAQLRRYQRALNLPAEVLPSMFVCCWARVAAAHAERAAVGGLDLAWWRSQPASMLWRTAIERPALLSWMG